MVAVAVFGIGEMLMAGTFFLAPFAIGAGAAAIAAWAGAGLAIQWGLFLGISILTLIALVPVRHRLNERHATEGIGAKRMIGRTGVVITAIPGGPGEAGEVRVDAELWRAINRDNEAVEEKSAVKVIDVEGTRLVVVRDTEG